MEIVYTMDTKVKIKNENGQTFTAKNNTTFVWANVSKTCGQK